MKVRGLRCDLGLYVCTCNVVVFKTSRMQARCKQRPGRWDGCEINGPWSLATILHVRSRVAFAGVSGALGKGREGKAIGLT